MLICVFLSVWMYITCMQEPVEIRREVRLAGTGLRDCCDLLCGDWVLRRSMLLTTGDLSGPYD